MVVRGLSDLENQSANSQNSRNGGVPSMALGQLLPSIPEILFPDLRLRSFIGIITLVDIAAFIITLLVGQFAYDGAFVKENDNVGPSVRTLSAVGGMDTSLIVNKYQLWRYVIPIILHAGLKHIGFNLFFQGSIGFRYETLWGTKHMALIYWIGGLAGTVLSALLNRKVVSVGASGALMGLLGAIIAFIAFNWKDLPDAPQRMCNVVMLLVLNALFGISSTGIDNWAHLGGVIGGGLAGTAFLKKSPMTATVKNVQTGAGFALAFYFIICLVVTFTSSPA